MPTDLQTMEVTFVQSQFCSGDSVKNIVVVEVKVSTHHLKTWIVSQEYQEWEDDEAQFAVKLSNPAYSETERSQDITLIRRGDISVSHSATEFVRTMDGTAINDGLQPIDAATPFLAGNVQFLPADASVQAPPAHPIPPLIPQQIVGPALMSLSSFSRQTRPENIWKAKLMVNKILNHPGIVDQDFFLIRIQFVKVRWWIRANAKGTLEKPEPKVVTTLAQGLTSPEDGNVEFQAISADGSVKSLFAHRSVLTFKSDVFKQGDHPPCPPKSTLLNPEEFESGFKEGIDPVVVLPNQCPRRVIHSTLKYEPLHVLLYYLYSGNVLFTTSVTIDDHLDMPIADAEAIFAGAHFYDISSLKGKAAAFLAGTCNEHNIVSRFFGDYALIYDELFEAYSRPFCRYWGQLKDTDEFDNTFEVRDTKEMTREELVRQVMYLDKVNRRFREFAKGFSMDCGTDSYYPMRAATPQQHYAMHQY